MSKFYQPLSAKEVQELIVGYTVGIRNFSDMVQAEKENLELAIGIVEKLGSYYIKYFEKSVQKDPKFILAILKIDPKHHLNISDYRDNKEVVLAARQQAITPDRFSERLRQDIDVFDAYYPHLRDPCLHFPFFKWNTQYRDHIAKTHPGVPKCFLSKEDQTLETCLNDVNANPAYYELFTEEFQMNLKVAFVASRKIISDLAFLKTPPKLHPSLYENLDFVKSLILSWSETNFDTIDEPFFRHLPDHLKSNEEIQVYALQHDATSIKYFKELQINALMYLIEKNPFVLTIPKEFLKQYPDLWFVWLKHDMSVYLQMSKSGNFQLGDKEFAIKCVQTNGYVIKFLREYFQKDRVVALHAIRNNPDSLICCKQFLSDQEIVRIAMKAYPPAFQYASPELRGDVDFVQEALELDTKNLQYLEPPAQLDRKIVCKVVQRNRFVVRMVHASLKTDPEILMATKGFYAKLNPARFYLMSSLLDTKFIFH